MSEPQLIRNPLLMVYRNEDSEIVTKIDTGSGDTWRGFALVIYDLVRHVADAFHVTEDEVWQWVQKERHHHTTDIRKPS
jgi:hypothetical protein